jgi:hypothetical protein
MSQYFAASQPQLSSQLKSAQLTMSKYLDIALNYSAVFDNSTGKPYFVSPKLGEKMDPFRTMIQNTLAMYSNFRYWTETLLALTLPDDYAMALMNFRETHTGSVSGITRWSDHLDDMWEEGRGHFPLSLYDESFLD